MISDGYRYYRIKLKTLSDTHVHRILELAGVRRFLYNFGIAYCEKLKEQGKGVPNFHTFCKLLTEMRHSEEYGWLKNYNVTSERYAFKDLVVAYKKFFQKINRYPKFKSKKNKKNQSCSIREDRFRISNDGLYAFIPGVSESVGDLIYIGKHNIPFGCYTDYDNIRIKFDGVDYWLSLSVKINYTIDEEEQQDYSEPIGVDVGVRTTATLSDGTTFSSPNREYLSRLNRKRNKVFGHIKRDQNKRYKQAVRTKTKYEDIPKSKNQEKRETQYQRLCNRMSNIIKTHNHTVSRQIADRKPRFVVLETLSVGSMERKSAKNVVTQIHSSSLYQLTQFIDYKCRDAGCDVIYAPRGFKSSQICSQCGTVNHIGSSKIYECSCCHTIIDRDLNAALNLRDFGYQYQNWN